MKYLGQYKYYFSAAIAICLLFAPIAAKSQGKIAIEPEQLTIAGTKNQKITRIITLSADHELVTEQLEISFRDLYRNDQLEVFPANAQTAALSTKQTSKSEYKILLEFDLQQANTKGEFAGKIVLRYQVDEDETEVIILPITTKIKSNWPLPLTSILLGTAVGMGLSWYRAKGRPRDEILVRVGRLETLIGKDPDFDRSIGFKSQIGSQLNNVHFAIQEERWEDAESFLAKAKIIWQKWQQRKTLWLPQLEYASYIEKTVAKIDPQQPFKGQILYQITAQVEKTPDLDSVEQLRSELTKIASTVNLYDQIKNQLAQIENLAAESTQVMPELARKWQPKIAQWQKQFANLTPDQDLDNFLKELTQNTSAMNEAIPRGKGTSPEIAISDPLIFQDAPIGIDFDPKKDFVKANQNLKFFAWTSYAIALILLIGAGFNEMYLKQETFGKKPFGDYFSLLAWGFGAEASREAIAKAIEGWGLAGLDQN